MRRCRKARALLQDALQHLTLLPVFCCLLRVLSWSLLLLLSGARGLVLHWKRVWRLTIGTMLKPLSRRKELAHLTFRDLVAFLQAIPKFASLLSYQIVRANYSTPPN